MTTAEEGYVLIPGGAVWYRAFAGERVPLLVVHGGPSATSDYLSTLAGLAPDRPVVFYDQLGCGRSQRLRDPSLWRIERFVEELHGVRVALQLERVHVLGHSWGGWLAIEYILAHGDGVEGLVLASTSASVRDYVQGLESLVDALPAPVAEALRGPRSSDDYRAALLEFYSRHLCRLPTWPAELVEAVGNLEHDDAYRALQGPNELVVTGALRNWDRRDRLGEIRVPTLVTVGRYDEVTPEVAGKLACRIPGAVLRVFEASAHVPHLEEPEEYIAAIAAFLARAETARVRAPGVGVTT